jgi:hypothetical protein
MIDHTLYTILTNPILYLQVLGDGSYRGGTLHHGPSALYQVLPVPAV